MEREHSRRKVIATAVGTIGLGSLSGCVLGEDRTYEQVQELPAPTLGEDDAPVTVRVFEDLGCPACRQFTEEVKPRLVEEFVQTGDVRFQWNDFVIPVTSQSAAAANAARAVQEELGEEAHWDFTDTAYRNQGDLSYDFYATVAEEFGVEDTEVVTTKARERTYSPVIETDKSEGNDIGVEGTPSVVVNGVLQEDFGYNTVARAIRQEL